jgi:hypothetical protein
MEPRNRFQELIPPAYALTGPKHKCVMFWKPRNRFRGTDPPAFVAWLAGAEIFKETMGARNRGLYIRTNEDSFLHMQLGANVTICYPRQNQYDVAWSESFGAPEKDRQRRHRHTSTFQ